MWLLAVILSGVVAMLAWQLAQRRPRHRPVALFKGAALIADVVRRGVALWILAPTRAATDGAPFRGLVRGVFHFDQALVLVYPAGLAALAFVVLLDGQARRSFFRGLAVVVAAALLTLFAAYPSLRHEPLLRTYLVLEFGALVAVVAAGVIWWRGPASPSLTEGSVLIFALLQAGALMRWHPAVSWEWQNMMSAGASAALIFLHLHTGELWNVSKQRSPS